MSDTDPVDELIHLAQAAAEAGEDWRALLVSRWIPEWLRERPRPALVDGLAEWGRTASTPGEDLGASLEAVVVAALDQLGYR